MVLFLNGNFWEQEQFYNFLLRNYSIKASKQTPQVYSKLHLFSI
jgi:hypothetical protein